jgi:hypothetical protein
MFSLLDQIPQTFSNSQETETILEPVIQSGIQALKVRFEDYRINRRFIIFMSSAKHLC